MEVNGGEKGEPCGVNLVDGQLLEESTNDYEDKKTVQGVKPSLSSGKTEENVEENGSGSDTTEENSQNDGGLVNGKEGVEDVDQSDDSVSTKDNEIDGKHSDKDVANDENTGSCSTTGNSENIKEEKSAKKECASLKSEKVSKDSEVSKSNSEEGNFNENSCVRGEGSSQESDLQNGKIEQSQPTKKTESAKKEVRMPMLVKPEALFHMPDFPTEKEHSKKPEEQFNVLIKTNDKKHLKHWLRSNILSVGHPVRSKLWLQTCKLVFSWGSSIFQDMVDEIFKGEVRKELPVPSFVDPAHMPQYFLTPTGVHQVHTVLIVLENLNPDITFCPSLFPLAALFLHFMEPEQCFECLYGMVRSRESLYLAQTKVAVDATHLVMRDLAKHHAKSAYSNISKDTDGNVEPVFRNWFWWIFKDLPFPYLVQVVDCYLFEGVKVLYRVALAILILYHKHTTKSRGNSSLMQGMNVSSKIKHFCTDIPYSMEKILKTAFGIRGLGKREVRKLQMRHEMCEKSHKVRMTRASSITRSMSRNSFSGPVKTHRSQSIPAPLSLRKSSVKGDAVSQDLLDAPTAEESDHTVHPIRSRSLSYLYVDEVTCNTLSHQDLMTIWGWLPARYTVCQPQLLYTSEEQGISLRTLYSKIDHQEPTLFVIKTTRNEIFGAFCSTDWRERIQTGEQKNLCYFGSGETFIFTLFPRRKVYEWVGRSGGEVPPTGNMFLAGDNHTLIVGGGNGTAIYLTDGLLRCRTERCDTFNNPPLCTTQDFACKVLEVFGFT
ncbi:GTPase-activating protein skywalker-like [Liolophura sinensis]|uniref:GTPase-activating protein skywalker-like n=1 Tax=Liolophura sinensis TaxID=3198878 RepID=UPI0031589539